LLLLWFSRSGHFPVVVF